MNTMHLTTASPEIVKTDRLWGWDTVFGIRYEYVNMAIAASERVPTSFFQSEQDEGDVISISGGFESWQLTVGGTGRSIMMSLKVPSVTLSRTNHSDQTRTGVEYVIKVTLQTVAGGAGPDGGELVNFVLASGPKGSNQQVVVEEVNYAGSEQDTTVKFFLRGLMEDWLNANVAQFDFVFSSVNLNSRADVAHWAWLRPTATGYAVYDDGATLGSGIFGVLCMTEDRAMPPDHQISADTIPEVHNGSFLLSKERFLTQVFRHGVGQMIDGPVTPEADKNWPEDYFELTDEDTMLTNTADLIMRGVEVEEGEEPVNFTIPARTFHSKLEESYLDIHFEQLNHPYKWFIGFGWLLDVTHEIQTRNIATLVGSSLALFPGSKTLDPNIQVVTHKPRAVKTDAAKKLDVLLIVLGLLSILLPVLKWGWTRYVAQGAEEIEGGAAAAGGLVMDAEIEAEMVVEADAAGAEAALGVIEGTEATFMARIMGQITARRAAILGVLSAAGWTAEQLLPYMADKEAAKELPRYDEFAAEIMKPITWPYASGFTVSEVTFNGSFQTMGEPKFDKSLVGKS